MLQGGKEELAVNIHTISSAPKALVFNPTDAMVADITSAEVFLSLTSQPKDVFIDAGASRGWREEAARFHQTGWDKQISIRASTLYRLPVASLLMQAWFSGGTVTEDAYAEMHTCLHEALVNALMHGCLSLGREHHRREEFVSYYTQAEALLQNQRHAEKRVHIRVKHVSNVWHIQVADEGEGYDYTRLKKQIFTLLTGRGLHLIHSFSTVAVEDGGRKLTMRFQQKKLSKKTTTKQPATKQTQDDAMPDIKNARVLLVDDNEFSIRLLSEIIAKQGFTQVETARDGAEALEKTHQFKPDIVLLDMMMPKMNGFEYCEQVRAVPEFKKMPILVITGISDSMEKVRAFEVGATDLINKPFGQDELLARMRVHLNNRALLQGLREYRRRTAEELESARHMQEQLLPKQQQVQKISTQYGVKIHSHYEPSSELGGDFWGIYERDADNMLLYMVDFSGHGVSAALNVFRLHALLEEVLPTHGGNPAKCLEVLNQKLFGLLPTGHFATMMCLKFTVSSSRLTYASAAAMEPMIKRKGGECFILDSSGFPLGVSGKSTYQNHEVPFTKGERLILYSDALVEARNREGCMMPSAFLTDAIMHSGSLETITENIVNAAKQHACGVIKDDLTAVLIERSA